MEIVQVVILDLDWTVLLLLVLLAIHHLIPKEIPLVLIATILVLTVVKKLELVFSAILDNSLTHQLWDALTVPPTPSTSTELAHVQLVLDVWNATQQQDNVLLVLMDLDSIMEHAQLVIVVSLQTVLSTV
mgnify:CR=1 FL=1